MEEQKSPLKLDFILDTDAISENSLVLLRVEVVDESVYGAVERLQDLYGKKFKEKNISFLILKPNTKIETISEKHMESLGWEKKNKSLIIH